MERPSVLILAAGKGERMRSDLPKVLFPLGGRPLLSYVLETARGLRPERIFLVVGHRQDEIRASVKDPRVRWIVQRRQRGTADAVRSAWGAIQKKQGPLFILYGDVPLLSVEALKRMQAEFLKEAPALAFLTARPDDPTGYGRVLRNGNGSVVRILEESDATETQRQIREVNTGIYLLNPSLVEEALAEIRPSAVTGEYYLTDVVERLVSSGKKVLTTLAPTDFEWRGVNNPSDLARCQEALRREINQRWMKSGVLLHLPETVMIDPQVSLKPGVVIHQGVVLTGRCRVEEGTEILPYSVIEESRIGRRARIGPFAHLRPGSVVGDEAHVGNFVELKKTVMKKGAKANHLSYLGDSVIGEETNVGAGTITCNYDGFRKNRTVIGRNVFIGSDTQLVAPVKVGDGAWLGAGTTVTENVPPGALALSRVEQKNIRGWVRNKLRKEKRGYVRDRRIHRR